VGVTEFLLRYDHTSIDGSSDNMRNFLSFNIAVSIFNQVGILECF